MSASHPGGPNADAQGGGQAADPSMEDILASIRRILSEDEPAQAEPPAGEAPAEVLTLQESMIVADEPPPEAVPPPAAAPPAPVPPASAPPPPPQAAPPQPAPVAPAPAAPVAAEPAPPQPAAPEAAPRPASPLEHLVAPEAEAAAAGSVSALLRTLVAGRDQVHVYRGGPTIEDLVREEIRPLLKSWLDTNLPPIVERLVRAEIERVVGRAIP